MVAAHEAAQPNATKVPFLTAFAPVAEEKGSMTIEELFADMGVEVEDEVLA